MSHEEGVKPPRMSAQSTVPLTCRYNPEYSETVRYGFVAQIRYRSVALRSRGFGVKKTQTLTAPGPELDERVRRSKELVLAMTFQLMQEGGIGGVSIDEVARRSRVAKTTIYRHWRSRAALLMDACSQLRAKDEAPDTGGLKGDVTAHLLRLAERMRGPGWPAILPSIIDAAERDQELAQLQARLQQGFREPLMVAIERAKKRGELPAREDASLLVASLVGPLVYRRWFTREPITESVVKSVVASALAHLQIDGNKRQASG